MRGAEELAEDERPAKDGEGRKEGRKMQERKRAYLFVSSLRFSFPLLRVLSLCCTLLCFVLRGCGCGWSRRRSGLRPISAGVAGIRSGREGICRSGREGNRRARRSRSRRRRMKKKKKKKTKKKKKKTTTKKKRKKAPQKTLEIGLLFCVLLFSPLTVDPPPALLDPA
jgi:hypothetical protein